MVGIEQNLHQLPDRVLADAGYRSEANIHLLEERGIDVYVAQGRGERAARKAPRKPAALRMAAKMATKAAREIYRRRKGIVEPPFGWIKAAMGFRSFSLRGLTAVAGEWDLVCLAANIRRMRVLRNPAWRQAARSAPKAHSRQTTAGDS